MKTQLQGKYIKIGMILGPDFDSFIAGRRNIVTDIDDNFIYYDIGAIWHSDVDIILYSKTIDGKNFDFISKGYCPIENIFHLKHSENLEFLEHIKQYEGK